MTSELMVSPIGLVTQPNKLGQYPNGALKEAKGVVIRDPGVITNYGGWSPFASGVPWASTATRLHIIAIPPGYTAKFCVFWGTAADSWRCTWIDSGGNTLADSNIFLTVFSAGSSSEVMTTFSHTFNRGRLIVAMRDSVIVADLPTGGSAPVFRKAGLSAPMPTMLITDSGAGSALAPSTHTVAVATQRRVYNDGYELVSAPSVACDIEAAAYSSASNIFVNTSGVGDAVPSSEYKYSLDVWRTRSQPVTYTTTYSAVNCGAEYRATGKGESYTTSTLTTSDPNLGEYLYTNPGIRGAGSAYICPRPAKCLATFKGHTFYGAYTEPPAVRIRPSTVWGYFWYGGAGSTLAARRNGIGTRPVDANVTSGSSTVTVVSVSSPVSSSAADGMIGIVKGQKIDIFAATFFSRTVLAVSGTTITLSSPAPVTATNVPCSVIDVLELNGTGYAVPRVDSGFFRFDDFTAQCLELISPDSTANLVYGVQQPAGDLVISRHFLANNPALKTLTVRATNGANWTPKLPSIEASETATTFTSQYHGNGIYWSEQNQPEHCPLLNVATVGTGEIHALAATRDALWIFSSDGLWRLSGNGGISGNPGYDWRIDPVDQTLSITSRRAFCVLRDSVYALTNRGLVCIDSSGNVKDLSQGRIGDFLPGSPFGESNSGTWLVADETNDEVLISDSTATALAQNILIYNSLTDSFTMTEAFSGRLHGCYSRELQSFFAASSVGVYKPSTAASSASSVKFQPVYMDNPFDLRRWQRVHYSFVTPTASVSVTPIVNDVSYTSNQMSVTNDWGSNLARVSFPVPINAPAVSNCLQFGYSTSIGALSLAGISVSAAPMTSQRKRRTG